MTRGDEVDRARTPDALASKLKRGLPSENGVRKLLEHSLNQDGETDAATTLATRAQEVETIFANCTEESLATWVEVLLPSIAPSVLSAWKALEFASYDFWGVALPFRLPPESSDSKSLRGHWLMRIALALGDFDRDITWVATHGSKLQGSASWKDLGWLLAGALDLRDEDADRVFDAIRDPENGERLIGQMSLHGVQALFACGRPDMWSYGEKLLLSAQRQEGLRQVLLESAGIGHPGAFRKVLQLLAKENLLHFSSVQEAWSSWFGLRCVGSGRMRPDLVLQRVESYLSDSSLLNSALEAPDAEDAYLALWALGFENVERAIEHGAALLADPRPEKRFVAMHLIAMARADPLPEAVVDCLADDDLRVAARALELFDGERREGLDPERVFGALEILMGRLAGRTEQLDPIVWPWRKPGLSRSAVDAAMVAYSDGVPEERVAQHFRGFDPAHQATFLRKLVGIERPALRGNYGLERVEAPEVEGPLEGLAYSLCLEALGSTRPSLRETALEALAKTPVSEDELVRLEHFLRRRPGTLRLHCQERIEQASEDRLFASVERLLDSKNGQQRLGGLELLCRAMESNRAPDRARGLARAYKAARVSMPETERIQISTILSSEPDSPRDDDALGLIDPFTLTEWAPPSITSVLTDTPASRASIDSLAALVREHGEHEFPAQGGRFLLIQLGYEISAPSSAEEAIRIESELPLLELWKAWERDRADAQRDPDGLEMLRLWIAGSEHPMWRSEAVRALGPSPSCSGAWLLRKLVEWCLYWNPPPAPFEFLLNRFESSLAKHLVASSSRAEPTGRSALGSEEEFRAYPYADPIRSLRALLPRAFTPEHSVRFYRLLTLASGSIRYSEFIEAYRTGAFGQSGPATLADLMVGKESWRHAQISVVARVTTQPPPPEFSQFPELEDMVQRVRARIVEVECNRGDHATAATRAALQLTWSGGLSTLSQAITALGDSKFARTTSWNDGFDSRRATLSHLVLRSSPRGEDTPESFACWAQAARIADSRLLELATYAPQWARHVHATLEWPGLESGVWWLHAHTKDHRWRVEDLEEEWAGCISQRTPLSAADLTDGAVDVEWFGSMHAELGKRRWAQLLETAKFASHSSGHKRAELFANALTGVIKRKALLERIDAKRHQDSVRALGLVPLSKGRSRNRDLLLRYERMQEFRRESRKYGAQRRASEERAVAIGLENLARTAGHKDPLRLQWAMEQESVRDLAEGSVVVTKAEVALTLDLDIDGKPRLEVRKKDKPQRSIPQKIRKDPDVVALRQRVKDLRRQASRIQVSLEESMCRGDVFEGHELQALLEHPILAPSLRRLVFVGDNISGYPVEAGQALRDAHGKLEPVRKNEQLRLAHPHDLLEHGSWSAWQRDCVRTERIQPFKQVFRELYPLTSTERDDGFQSRRYAGHQVQPAQAVALLGARGWVPQPYEGIAKTFHAEGFTARLEFEEGYSTPASIEGLTLDSVFFTKKAEFEPVNLTTLPPRLFSEAMRDLDLVVSVAHCGGVDPEATASTIEMRGMLIRETIQLLGLENVEIKNHHAIIEGTLARYSVHLGSANIHMMGGGALIIVAVHSQHRGRLFLPFADDDPRTAEVLSKVLLLARDHEIQDPILLEQIHRNR